MVALTLIALLASPVRTADTLPPEARVLHLAGGLLLLNIDISTVPPLPVFAAEASAGFGLVEGLDLRATYETELGLTHRLGPELRGRLWKGGGFAVGARLAPTAEVAGAFEEGTDFATILATRGGLLSSLFTPFGAFTFDAALDLQLYIYSDIDGVESSHAGAFPAYVDLALDWERALDEEANLFIRVEYGLPLSPDTPHTVLGGFPRLLAGGNFSY